MYAYKYPHTQQVNYRALGFHGAAPNDGSLPGADGDLFPFLWTKCAAESRAPPEWYEWSDAGMGNEEEDAWI